MISKINIYSNKQTCYIQVTAIKIKNHKKITHFSLNLKNMYVYIYIYIKKYNSLSKIFHKINLKLYSNVTTHNQTYE